MTILKKAVLFTILTSYIFSIDSMASHSTGRLISKIDLLNLCSTRMENLVANDYAQTLMAMTIYKESLFPEGTRGCCGQEKWKIITPAKLPSNLDDIVNLAETNFFKATNLVTSIWERQIEVVTEVSPEFNYKDDGKKLVLEGYTRAFINNSKNNVSAGIFTIISDPIVVKKDILFVVEDGLNLEKKDLYEISDNFSCIKKIIIKGI